jgi:DNA-directed RNA polymerase subunit RPC12/RpoP
VAALAPLALGARHPQTQQYAIRALSKYGARQGLRARPSRSRPQSGARDYVRAAAATAADAIERAAADAESGVRHRCQRCGASVGADETERSRQAFQRVYCDRCFDEVFLERRNFETQVELNKTVEARDGTLVQSEGERRIAEWLAAHGLAYRYDAKIQDHRRVSDPPRFLSAGAGRLIEYWGLDTPQYKMTCTRNRRSTAGGQRLISVYPADLPQLDRLMTTS